MLQIFEACRIDELGRIALPSNIRERFGWQEYDTLLLSPNIEDNTVVLKLFEKCAEQKCTHCGKKL